MLIYAPGIPTRKLKALRTAVTALIGNLKNNNRMLPSDLNDTFTMLVGTDPVQSSTAVPMTSFGVVIAYDPQQVGIGPGPYAYTAGPCIWMCERSFAEGQDRVNAVLCHELVHVACGWELDSEAFERGLFPRGATQPDLGDWENFQRRNWKGRWVYLQKDKKNQSEAQVLKKEGHVEVCRFKIPQGVSVP